MRIACWNVNGLRAIADKGFDAWLRTSGFDLVLLQETKVLPNQVDRSLEQIGEHRLRLFAAERPGYSGVGIYHRREPDEWIEGLGEPAFDGEGRLLAARYGEVLVCSAYFPNSQAEGARLGYRLAFGDALRRFLRAQRRRGRHVVLGGDFNVAHEEIDLARPKQNTKNPGFLPEERQWMTAFLADGFVDTWRRQHPGEVGYSWWSYRSGARQKNIGWRLDYLCVDEGLWPRVRATGIQAGVEGSDHCPVTVELDG
jgi:exodeoxyribonuclease-3